MTLSSVELIAQFDLEVYNEFKSIDNLEPYTFIGSGDSSFFYMYSEKKNGRGARELRRFDNHFTPSDDKLAMNEGNENFKVYSLGTFKLDDWLVQTKYRVEDTRAVLIVESVDLNSLQKTVETEIETVQLKKPDQRGVRFLGMTFLDSVSIALAYVKQTDSKDRRNIIVKTLTKTLRDSITTEYEFNHGHIIKSQFQSDELIVLSAKIPKSPTVSLDTKLPEFEYSLFSLRNNKIEPQGRVSNEGKWLRNPLLLVNDSTVRVVGLYVQRAHPHGTFFYEKKTSTSSQVVQPFKEDLLKAQLNSRKYGKRAANMWLVKHKELRDFKLTSCLTYEDGSLLLVAEEIITDNSTMFIFQNLALIKLTMEGNIEWSRVIKKDNSRSKGVYSSYLVAKNKDRYALIYNGNSQNLKDKTQERYNAFKGSGQGILVAEIDKSGEIDQYMLTGVEGIEDYRILPGLSRQTIEEKVVLYSRKLDEPSSQRFIVLTPSHYK